METTSLFHLGWVNSEYAFVFTCLHAELRNDSALEAQNTKVATLTDSHRSYRCLVDMSRLNGDFRYSVVSITPQERPALISIG